MGDKSTRKYIAECIGTMILVILGCGVAMFIGRAAGDTSTAARIVGISFAFGLSIIATAYVIGNISGCHINPAVSFAMLVTGKLSLKDFIGYIISQFAGAIIGALILMLIAASAGISVADIGLGQNGFGAGYGVGINAGGALLVEIVLTFVFVFTILGVTSDPEKNRIAGVVIGFTLVLVHLLGINLTGTSVNPARSFGPALFAGLTAISQVWVFIIGPMIGSAIAALTFKALTIPARSPNKRK